MSGPVELRRSLSLPLVVLYGLGTIVGAGIYALMGEIAATAGILAPLAFALASILAAFSGISLAELSSRFPKSAGEAVYVLEGFSSRSLSTLVGIGVILSGIVSSATILNGFVGYVQDLAPVSRELAIIGVGGLIGIIAVIGIGPSVGLAALITVIEVGGLILIVSVGAGHLPSLPDTFRATDPSFNSVAVMAVIAATVPAFYAFIGFEDMVNVAEEVKNPSRNLPRAILLTMALTAVIYILVALVSVAVVPVDRLAGHGAPLTLVFEEATGSRGGFISTIGILAMLNGALIQIIMASRVLYGLAQQGSLPRLIGRVNPKTQTPMLATALATGIVIILAIFGTLGGLARLTSFIVLIVFTLVNVALILIKRRGPAPEGVATYPGWVPVIGALTSGAFAIWQLASFLELF